jgi:hypothetical protein
VLVCTLFTDAVSVSVFMYKLYIDHKVYSIPILHIRHTVTQNVCAPMIHTKLAFEWLALITEVSSGFPQSFEANARIVS